MNYGETLAYWYLRLNGFFPMTNYVLHRKKDVLTHSADCDIIAVRHPYVYEEVGGQPGDWHHKFREFGVNIEGKMVGGIVEVKTGEYSRRMHRNIMTSFSPERISCAVNRFGFCPPHDVAAVCEQLNVQPHFENDNLCIMKLLIADVPDPIEGLPMHQLTLTEVDSFISHRFEFYQQKFPDRHFFPSDLMQYMIWKSTPRQH